MFQTYLRGWWESKNFHSLCEVPAIHKLQIISAHKKLFSMRPLKAYENLVMSMPGNRPMTMITHLTTTYKCTEREPTAWCLSQMSTCSGSHSLRQTLTCLDEWEMLSLSNQKLSIVNAHCDWMQGAVNIRYRMTPPMETITMQTFPCIKRCWQSMDGTGTFFSLNSQSYDTSSN